MRGVGRYERGLSEIGAHNRGIGCPCPRHRPGLELLILRLLENHTDGVRTNAPLPRGCDGQPVKSTIFCQQDLLGNCIGESITSPIGMSDVPSFFIQYSIIAVIVTDKRIAFRPSEGEIIILLMDI
jgi:hypothetical protein